MYPYLLSRNTTFSEQNYASLLLLFRLARELFWPTRMRQKLYSSSSDPSLHDVLSLEILMSKAELHCWARRKPSWLRPTQVSYPSVALVTADTQGSPIKTRKNIKVSLKQIIHMQSYELNKRLLLCICFLFFNYFSFNTFLYQFQVYRG